MLASEQPRQLPEQPSFLVTQNIDYAALDARTPVVQLRTTQIKPHPRNEAIYGEEDVIELVEHIRESNWVKPLVCTPTGTIISGHRRWKAAIELRLETVPVEVREFSDELAELEALLLENANRLKTTEQKVREAEAWKEVETHKAKTRQIVLAGTRPNSNPNLQENFPSGRKGQARDAIASRVGLGSGRNYEKAAKVVTQIGEETSLGHPEVAKALRKVLNEQSVDAAHTLLVKSPHERHAIANLIINGSAKTTKQAERMVRKDNLTESDKTTQAISSRAFVAEPNISIVSKGDSADEVIQSNEELLGEVAYEPASDVASVVDSFNFSGNGHPNLPTSGIPVPCAGRNHSDAADVSDHKSAITPRSKVESEISEICNVLDKIFTTVQHFDDEQKDEVFERLVDYLGAETLGRVIIRFLHQYEIAELCHKCFCAMNEETFPKLRLAELKVSVLELLDKEVQQAFIKHQNGEQESKN